VKPRPGFSPDWLTARPIAHRGLHDSSRGVAENSLGSARAAFVQNYAMECDLQLSRDGRIFVFHDDALERMCGESGNFRDLDSGVLQTKVLRGSGEAIPTLEQLLGEAQGAASLILELKSDFSGDVALAAAVASALGDYGGPVALKSFDPALIAFLRATKAPWPLGIVAQADYAEAEWAGLTASQCFALSRFIHAAETQPDFLSWRAADLPNPTCEFARACAGTPVMTWTIRSPEAEQAARRHADQIVFEGFMALVAARASKRKKPPEGGLGEVKPPEGGLGEVKPPEGGMGEVKPPLGGMGLENPKSYLILVSLNSTCLRTTGSYFLNVSLSVLVRAFFLET
jgi:glycerophosphoryl diester phosphodiesterase